MDNGIVIVVDNAVEAATRLFKRAYAEVGLDANFFYAPNFSEGIRRITEQNGNLVTVVTELLDTHSSSVMAEIIFATRRKGDSRYIPIIAHTNSYSSRLERFARVMGIDVVVEKGAQSAQRVCRVIKDLQLNPKKYQGTPLMVPQPKVNNKGESYFPFEQDYANLRRLRRGITRL